jgi:hypothetical protein
VEQKRNLDSTSASSASSAIYNIVEQKRKLQVWELKTAAYIYMYIQCVHIYLEINGYSYIIWALRQSASGTETICLWMMDLFNKGPHAYIYIYIYICVCIHGEAAASGHASTIRLINSNASINKAPGLNGFI